jgi:hypothetical protein
MGHFFLATLLATGPDELRDGLSANQHAKRACASHLGKSLGLHFDQLRLACSFGGIDLSSIRGRKRR